MARQIYRKSALERLSSPEQLDSLMQVTTSKGWIALFAVAVVLAGALTWGFMGRTPDVVAGGGIILREGGIFIVEASGSGVIDAILVNVGDSVKLDQVVARISEPALDQSIGQALANLQELEANRERARQLLQENLELELASTDEDINRLEQTANALTDSISFLEKRVAAQNQAVAAGLITEDVAQATAQQLADARANLIGTQAQLEQARARKVSLRNQSDTALFDLEREIDTVKRQLAVLELRKEEESETESAYEGTVVGLLMDQGQHVDKGTPLLQVELSERHLEALVFVPLEGPRVKPGQTVQMSPEGITWEEYGYMLGTVMSVSDSPMSPDAMARILRNTALVQQFSAAGGVYLVTVQLETVPVAAGQPTQFRWTSSRVPDSRIGTGTLLTAQITVDERPPIALVIPAIRRWIGV